MHSSFQSHIKAVDERPCQPAEQEVSCSTNEEQQHSRPSTPEPAKHNVADALRR